MHLPSTVQHPRPNPLTVKVQKKAIFFNRLRIQKNGGGGLRTNGFSGLATLRHPGLSPKTYKKYQTIFFNKLRSHFHTWFVSPCPYLQPHKKKT